MLDVRIGSEVYCRDGRAGRLERVVLSPRRRQVTHLVVAKGLLLRKDVVVPIELVERVEDGRVYLSLTIAELNQLPEYHEFDYVAPDPTWHPVHEYEPAQTVLALDPYGAAIASDQPALAGRVLRHEHPPIPEDMVFLRRGTPVECRAGRLGVIDHVLLDPERRYVTHFVVRRGAILARDVVVPVDWVTRINADGVFVDAGSEQVRRLPEYRPRRTDAELLAAVQAALRADPRTRSSDIDVRVEHGMVELRGRATDLAARIAASEIVRAVPGVIAARNLLATGPSSGFQSASGLDYAWVEQFLAATSGLRVDKSQAEAIVASTERKLTDLFDVAENTALANGREMVYWHDLPLTKGFQATLRTYERRANEPAPAAIEACLRDMGILSGFDEQVRARLPRLFGALLFVTGRVLVLLTPRGMSAGERLAWLTQPRDDSLKASELERAMQLLDLTL